MKKTTKAAQMPPSITLRLSRGRSVKITWRPRQRVSSLLVKLLTKALAVFLPLSMGYAQAADVNALPTGGQVTAGSATINQTGNTLNINQASQKAALNWQTFNIGTNGTVNFVQPNSNAVALNRIGGNSASEIYGHLNANGQVFLMNPNGILFGRGSQVNVGGIVATTMQLGDADFLAGNYNFSNAGVGSVANYGLINATNSVAFLGGDVTNQGSIFATTASLVSGNTVALDVSTDGLIRARVVDVAMQANIANSGDINAAQVTLSAGQAKDTLNRVVNNSGVIKATGFSSLNGEITLQGGTTLNSGTLDATSATGNGGTVHMLGQHVGVVDSGSIDVSGATGGGTILVGGDYQGKNANIENAEVTYVGAQTTLKADATQNGNGGKVIVWADDTTRAYGSISAQGGVLGGNGGFVETSGHRYLDVDGVRVDTRAPQGVTGTWLLDPTTIVITPPANPTSVGVSTGPNFSASSGVNNLDVTDLLLALDSTAVSVLADDLIVSTPINDSANTNKNNLTLVASNGTLQINSPITLTNKNLVAQSTLGDINVNGAIAVGSGNVTLQAGNDLSLLNASVTSSSNILIDAASVTLPTNATNLLHADNSVIIRTSTITIPAGTTISGNFVELGPQGNDDMSIYTGTSCGSCSGLQILVSDLNRLFASDTLILGRPIADTNYTGTLTVKSNTLFDDSDIQAPKLALNGYDVAIDNNASFGDSEISFGKHMDILVNNNLAIDGSLYLGSNNVLLSAPNGEIVQGGSSVISANGTLTANAANGIDLDGNLNNQVTTFIATNTSMNDIDFYNAGDVEFGNITNQASGGHVDVESGGGIVQFGDISTIGGDITVWANNDINMTFDGARSSALIHDATSLNFIDYQSRYGNVNLDLLDAGLGTVGVTAGLNITDGNDAYDVSSNPTGNNIKASYAGLNASQDDAGPGIVDVDTQVQSIFVDNEMVYWTTGQALNPISIRNTGSALLIDVTSAADTGELTITNDNIISVGGISGATNTTITSTSHITLYNQNILSDGNVKLDAGGDILITDNHIDAGGSVEVIAGGNIILTNGYIDAQTGMDITADGYIKLDATTSDARLYTFSGNQNITSGSYITLRAGSVTDAYAEIEHDTGTGDQTIDFTQGGTLTLTGGIGLSGNYARIDNKNSDGTQKIWRSTSSFLGDAPLIVMNGGASGGDYIIPSVVTFLVSPGTNGSSDGSNSAEINSEGRQEIYANTITMDAGAGDYAGAIISAPDQQITTAGDVTLWGGSSNSLTLDDQFTYSDGTTYNLASPAAIGDKNTLNQTLDIGGTLTLNGGSSTSGIAMVGSLHGVATGSIKANAVALNSSGSLAFLGGVEDIIVTNTFTNVGGAITDNSSGSHPWSIWALNPTKITGCGTGSGCLADFAQYGLTYGLTANPAIQGSGHGWLYSAAAPALTATTSTNYSRVYDSTANAYLAATNFTVAGANPGDTVALTSLTGNFANKNVGTAKAISGSAATFSVTAAGIPVYGYASPTISGLSADITQATLNWSVANATGNTGTTPVPGLATLSVIFGSDAVNGVVSAYDANNVLAILSTATPEGVYTEKVTGLTGADAGNYSLASTGTTGVLTVGKSVITPEVEQEVTAVTSETISQPEDTQTKQEEDEVKTPEKVLVALNFVDDPNDNKENPIETEKPKGRTLQCSVNK